MAKPPKISLPSGKQVPLSKKADPSRPWEPYEDSGFYQVVRARRGDSTQTERFSADRLSPLLLSKSDAESLSQALNEHHGARLSSPRK